MGSPHTLHPVLILPNSFIFFITAYPFKILSLTDGHTLQNAHLNSNKTEPYTEPSTPGQSDPWQNIRQYHFPTYASDYPTSVRCGRDNMAHASSTETLKVKAGDKVEMAHQRFEPSQWEDNQWYGCPDNRGTCHPQWVQVRGIYSERRSE
jgi:hypothetical protein